MSLLESSSYGMVPKNVILMFYWKSYCPKIYLLNIDERELGVSPGIFLILLEQRFCGTLVSNICALEFPIYSFPR